MSDIVHSLEHDELVTHHAWMRGLARRLVLDDAEADDVVQEAWKAALEKPPQKRESLRAWLGTVIRNAAKQIARSESRRGHRERAVARSEALPDTVDLVSRAEARRVLLEAVLGLDEPNRSTVLLRFFEGLTPRAIAERQDVPIDTVRGRLRRGLDQMRTKLDATHGDRRSWALLLLPLAAPPIPGAPGAAPPDDPSDTPDISTGTKLTVGGIVLSTVVGLAVGWVTTRATTPDEAPPAVPTRSVAELRRDVESLRELAETRESMIAELRRSGVPAAPETTPGRTTAANDDETNDATTDAATPTGMPIFRPASHADALDAIDWNEIGPLLLEMTETIPSVISMQLGDIPQDGAIIGRLQTINGRVIEVGAQLVVHGAPGEDLNDRLFHPVVAANLVAATLDAADLPLTPEQRTALIRVSADAADTDARAREYESPYVLARYAEVARARIEYFRAVRELLTSVQADTISPALTRDRISVDLFSGGILFMPQDRARPPSREMIADATARNLVRYMRVERGGTLAERIESEVHAWMAALPESAFIDANATPLDHRAPTVDHWFAWVDHRVALLEQLDSVLDIDDATRALLRSSHGKIPIPVLQTAWPSRPDSEED